VPRNDPVEPETGKTTNLSSEDDDLEKTELSTSTKIDLIVLAAFGIVLFFGTGIIFFTLTFGHPTHQQTVVFATQSQAQNMTSTATPGKRVFGKMDDTKAKIYWANHQWMSSDEAKHALSAETNFINLLLVSRSHAPWYSKEWTINMNDETIVWETQSGSENLFRCEGTSVYWIQDEFQFVFSQYQPVVFDAIPAYVYRVDINCQLQNTIFNDALLRKAANTRSIIPLTPLPSN
jgi:hypothetical protein